MAMTDDPEADLLAACRELRAALAALMRVVVTDPTATEITERWIAELTRIGIEDGIGVRADKAIAKAEAH